MEQSRSLIVFDATGHFKAAPEKHTSRSDVQFNFAGLSNNDRAELRIHNNQRYLFVYSNPDDIPTFKSIWGVIVSHRRKFNSDADIVGYLLYISSDKIVNDPLLPARLFKWKSRTCYLHQNTDLQYEFRITVESIYEDLSLSGWAWLQIKLLSIFRINERTRDTEQVCDVGGLSPVDFDAAGEGELSSDNNEPAPTLNFIEMLRL